ncbi:hypothetical protein [uncultured Imperialibacter sp.]|uniref:hypothetical protein n=1 Tax=uncultured Imperialibacter sp. TaxID=1672639 RepID=UPI0030DB42B1
MIYYQAVCDTHGFASSLFSRKVDALRSGQSHIRNVAGPHNIRILEVYVPTEAIEVRSDEPLA